MAVQQKIAGYYNNQPIYAGTDAEVASQIAAIDAKKVQVAPPTPVTKAAPAQKTQAQVDAEYAAAAASHPVLASNTPEMLNYAMSTGDFSSLVDTTGKPFSVADQRSAVSEAEKAINPYYTALETKDTQDTESALAAKQREYQSFLSTQGENFQADKTALDQDAANKGVLFSGARVQKERQLQDSYNRANTEKRASVGASIGDTARDFGYKYGDQAAQGLGSFFNLGANTYNANKATGGVGTSGLSSIYNANQGFQGTTRNTQKADVQKRAAGLLYNKGNKLLASGYTNQY